MTQLLLKKHKNEIEKFKEGAVRGLYVESDKHHKMLGEVKRMLEIARIAEMPSDYIDMFKEIEKHESKDK